MIVIGIDPGITGAISFISDDSAHVFDLPLMAKGKGQSKVKNQINASGLYALIEDNLHDGFGIVKAKAYLERTSAMPGQGVASMFSMGDTYGCIRGVLAVMGIPTETIAPQKWKRFYGLGNDKEVARAKAIELYPQIDLSRKKDHNRAEALLIGRYGMRQN